MSWTLPDGRESTEASKMNAIRRLALVFVLLFVACGRDNCCNIEGNETDWSDCDKCVEAGGSCHSGRCGAAPLTNLLMANMPKVVNISITDMGLDRNYGSSRYQIVLSDEHGNQVKFSGWGTDVQTPARSEYKLNLGVADKDEWNSGVSAVSDVLPFVKEEVYK